MLEHYSDMTSVLVWINLLLFTTKVVYSDVSFTKPLFSTKTAYFWVKDASENIPENQYSTAMYHGQTCRLEGLNVLFRHAARYPTIKWIQKMTKLQTKLKNDAVVVSRMPFLQQYSNPFAENEESLLSSLGKEEMTKLGRRFAQRFHMVLAGNLDKINFTVTFQDRTLTSFSYFYYGLNETFASNIAKPDALVDNRKLRFFDSCQKYIQQVEHNDNVGIEAKTFLHGKEMTDVLKKVQARLGSNATLDEVMVMQQYCAFELGIYNHSDWCQLFDVDDLKVIDYSDDIQDYHEWGYAYPINWQQSCPFTSYMFETFDNIAQTHDQLNRVPQVNIGFGHAETVFPVLTALGLFNDSQALLANNFAVNNHRKFHGAVISPFAANIAIGLYKCSADYYVTKFFVNEEAVDIPACGHTVCSYSDVRRHYSNQANCNFDQICDPNYNGQSIIG